MKLSPPWLTIAAFAIAPLGAAAAMSTMTRVSGHLDLLAAMGLLPVFYVFAAAPTLLIGVPLYVILSRYERVNVVTTVIAGGVVGVVAACMLRCPAMPEAGDLRNCVGIGILSSLMFWAVWRCRQWGC